MRTTQQMHNKVSKDSKPKKPKRHMAVLVDTPDRYYNKELERQLEDYKDILDPVARTKSSLLRFFVQHGDDTIRRHRANGATV